ncbi:MAG: hypothetical protein K6C69_07190 [Lachnospiraceae bacterium]|nr:hypothetical protein [Lachnospiraceae bacterium]
MTTCIAICFILSFVGAILGIMWMPEGSLGWKKKTPSLDTVSQADNALTRFFVSIMILWIYWTIVVGLWNRVTTKPFLDLIFFLGMNLAVMVVTGLCMYRKGRRTLAFPWKDGIFFGILLVAAVALSWGRFQGYELFGYESGDAVKHFGALVEITKEGRIVEGCSRYALYLMDFAWMQTYSVLASDTIYGEVTGSLSQLLTGSTLQNLVGFRAFLAVDTMLLVMQVGMFYSLLKTACKGRGGLYRNALVVGCTFFYCLGYPLNVFLYGFEYLGMGVLVLTFLLWYFVSGQKSLLLLAATNFSLVVSYAEFAPGIFVGEMIYFIVQYGATKNHAGSYGKAFLRMVACGVIGLLLPGLVAITYIRKGFAETLIKPLGIGVSGCALVLFVLFFLGKKTGRSPMHALEQMLFYWNRTLSPHIRRLCYGGVLLGMIYVAYRYLFLGMIVRYMVEVPMTYDGNVYRGAYAGFILLLFPMLGYVVEVAKKRRVDVVLTIALVTVGYCVVLFYLVQVGLLATYYFYKMYFILWPLAFLMAFAYMEGLAPAAKDVHREARHMMEIYLGGVIFLFVIFASNLDAQLKERNYWSWDTLADESVFGIYHYNRQLWDNETRITLSEQEAYGMVHAYAILGGAPVQYFGYNDYHMKMEFYNMTYQQIFDHQSDFFMDDVDYPDPLGVLRGRGTKYLYVTNSYVEEGKYMWAIEPLRCVYEGDAGRIYSLED